jgi:hypothetical protein
MAELVLQPGVKVLQLTFRSLARATAQYPCLVDRTVPCYDWLPSVRSIIPYFSSLL